MLSDTRPKGFNGELCDLPGLIQQHWSELRQTLTNEPVIDNIEAEREIAIIFTSGSTGHPKPYIKPWGDMVLIGRSLGQRFLSAEQPGHQRGLLATVPAQHMYGLETSIMMALQNGCLIHAQKPFFPRDIVHCLEDFQNLPLTIDTTLVTTPLHLKACLKTEVELPGVSLFLSATAPLPIPLAQDCEKRYQIPVNEIYGCTEIGSMAWRQTTSDESWIALDDITLQQGDNETFVSTSRNIGHFVLHDVIEWLDDKHFLLKGRKEDLINLAGKRTSLAYLNHHLQSFPGLQDGCFYQNRNQPESRLIAFVVASTNEDQTTSLSNQIRNHLKERIDPVFLPRHIFFLDSLPRNTTGKLPALKLKELYKRYAPS
jgi:acyl-coenzyme A synthetase/AMP-(fatty) acid ligase